jgi:hypothetical protein
MVRLLDIIQELLLLLLIKRGDKRRLDVIGVHGDDTETSELLPHRCVLYRFWQRMKLSCEK